MADQAYKKFPLSRKEQKSSHRRETKPEGPLSQFVQEAKSSGPQKETKPKGRKEAKSSGSHNETKPKGRKDAKISAQWPAQSSTAKSPRAQKFSEGPTPPQRRTSVQAYKYPRVQHYAEPSDDIPYEQTSGEKQEFPRAQKFSETPVPAERRTSVLAYKYPRVQQYAEPSDDILCEEQEQLGR